MGEADFVVWARRRGTALRAHWHEDSCFAVNSARASLRSMRREAVGSKLLLACMRGQ